LAVGVDPGALSKNPLRLKVAEQPNGVDCGFHVVLNECALADQVHARDRDEGAAVTNLKDDWQPPPSALPVQHITALPFGVGVYDSTS
jgi:hypothetical protein